MHHPPSGTHHAAWPLAGCLVFIASFPQKGKVLMTRAAAPSITQSFLTSCQFQAKREGGKLPIEWQCIFSDGPGCCWHHLAPSQIHKSSAGCLVFIASFHQKGKLLMTQAAIPSITQPFLTSCESQAQREGGSFRSSGRTFSRTALDVAGAIRHPVRST